MVAESVSFGVHYMFDGYGCPEGILSDADKLKSMLREIPDSLGMHLICDPVVVSVGANNRKDPGGLSGFVMIAESHISFHTFPKRGFVTADVYSCQTDLDMKRLEEFFVTFFGATNFETFSQDRGRRYPDENLYD